MTASPPPPRAPRIERRIFVVGVPRSGTTLVQGLLAAHDAVASSTESHFFDRHFRLLPGLPDRALLVRDPAPAVREFLRENRSLQGDGDSRGFEEAPPLPLRHRLLLPFRSDSVARRLLAVLDELAGSQGCPVWVEKTPAHLRYVRFLERVAGCEAGLRFVHVIRDGLETVASLHRASARWERRYGLDECVRRWNSEVRLSLSRVRSPADRFVFYEDLTREPEATVRRLLDGLGLPWQPDVLDRYGEAAARLTAPGEAAWKRGVGRAIRPSATVAEALTGDQRRRAQRDLRSDLYERLREAVPAL